ncbi:TPA: carbohydrate kinase family protein [Candidatus Berkelbacteria bacterium]|uniref:Putative Ribokinase n=1 Tax=Berkelbacteria bacterium GW2011_GWE1_39_12 TaxID=1618337 RepID=A0A0G4B3I7_9BACT|nr:MAG: putative Ribokinase [Berkelbacteria bacterium GW2011_GWE1_39_12]HBO60623.1 carbohydrate kinase family protein [Candidatus Berkelbacteria bacterium]
MKNQVTTIGDAMKDIFVFPAIDEMKKPVSGADLHYRQTDEKFLVLGYGDKITISDSFDDIGGTACNVAVGLSKLGIKSALIGAYGKDDDGQEIFERLINSKVNTENFKSKNKNKSSFSVIISFKGERSILVYHAFEPQDFDLPKNLDSEWLYVSPMGEGYQSLFSKMTSLAAEKNIKIAWNPGSVQLHDGLQKVLGLLSVTEILFINKEEARMLVDGHPYDTVKQIAKNIHQYGPKTVVITDGKEGAYVFEQGEFIKVGIYPGSRVESTGAGDSFAAGFLAAKIKGEELITCLKWGVTNSASVVGKFGAQQGLLSNNQIKLRVDEYRWPAESLRFS